jgi:uncharacterized protein YjdB
MFARNCFKVLGLIAIVLPFTGCTNTQISTIDVTPAIQSLAVGQTLQYTATGVINHGSHPSTSSNVTNEVTWSSSTPSVASVSSSGVATAVAAGSVTISATMAGSPAGSATLTVTSTGGGTAGGALISLAIIPGTQSVASPKQTSQFIAIGTTSSGATEDLTSQVTWGSSSAEVATITPGGLATAVSQGTSTITAIATNSNNTVVTGTATFTVQGGASEPITLLTITPSNQSVSASGQTGQFIALGSTGSTGGEEDVTSSPNIQWISSIPTIATVSNSGVVTGVSQGTSAITALWTNPDLSIVSASASVTVTLTAAPEPLLSLTIIPSVITVGNLQDTGNFLAIGTYSTTPTVRDLTNTVNWISSAPSVFPVNTNATGVNDGAPGGVVTAYGSGGAVIIAEATDATTGSIETATANFNCPLVIPTPTTAGSCYPGSQASALLSTVTVYNEGLNTTDWLVTAPSATGTPNVIHCGPGSSAAGLGASVCVATYPVGASITLTAPAGAGKFGGWSSTCATISPDPSTQNGPNTCSIIPATTNETVGAIFN